MRSAQARVRLLVRRLFQHCRGLLSKRASPSGTSAAVTFIPRCHARSAGLQACSRGSPEGLRYTVTVSGSRLYRAGQWAGERWWRAPLTARVRAVTKW